MDDRVPVLAAENFSRFKKLRTIPHFSLHLLISTIISIFGIILAATWPDSKRCEAYFIMLYVRAGFWIITWVFDYIVKYHHDQLRLNGYHDFYRATKTHKSVPLTIVSLWNTALLTVAAGIHHYYGDNFFIKCMESFLSPVVYVTAFTVAETFVLFAVHGTYIYRVHKFNTSQMPPDALQGINTVLGSVGLMQRGADITELLEKQADLINYLRDHNMKLNQKLMQVTNQFRPSI
ncbi:CLUMA_CG014392, isoform A [Clunio marinus]|uniref:Transmembrane protein 192 n=1 Tax=Clunio marinus TaxID=568069 RepID=A0A1J1IP61_9DIPT|nr:CLUMA_CG014392, isoform A [Clunio marinus]